MGMSQEMMQDQFDMMGDPETEGQADDVYNQILGEIGMSVSDGLATNNNSIAQPAAAAAVEVSDSQLCNVRICCRTPATQTCKQGWMHLKAYEKGTE